DLEKTLPGEEAEDVVGRLLGAGGRRVQYDRRVRGRLIDIRDAGELLDEPGARLRVEALHIALLAGFELRPRVHEHEAADRLDHLAHFLPNAAIRANRRAERDAAVLRNLGRHITDPPDVHVSMLLRESQLGGQVAADDISVEERHGALAKLEQLDEQNV